MTQSNQSSGIGTSWGRLCRPPLHFGSGDHTFITSFLTNQHDLLLRPSVGTAGLLASYHDRRSAWQVCHFQFCLPSTSRLILSILVYTATEYCPHGHRNRREGFYTRAERGSLIWLTSEINPHRDPSCILSVIRGHMVAAEGEYVDVH